MAAPEKFVEHLRDHGYHPRSNAHSNAVCEAVLRDLRSRCPKLAEDLARGRVAYDLNVKLQVGNNVWNIDLVLGPPPAVLPPLEGALSRVRPATIRIAIETKAIMTEHGKARRNRQRDLDSFHQFVHRYNSSTVAGALTVVNIAERFRSPLRPGISVHRNIRRLTEETLMLLRLLPARAGATEGPGLEANGAIVVEHDNIENERTHLISRPPAPQVGDPLHYDAFIQHICDQYTQRWGRPGD
jgi:hypothetical protein